jgi:EAL domain-containing protein (putative c-di-GMP-specific phosphodiesterase class I)
VAAGVAVGTADRPISSILTDASAALGRAKEGDRCQLELATRETRRSALVELDLEYELRDALNGGEMRLHFQPIVRFGTGAHVAGEALLRWSRVEADDLLTTERVVSVAEETGLIIPLGDWVVTEALAVLRRRHFPCVTVNVSPRQLLDPGFPIRVDRAIRMAGVPARRLALEITEAVAVEDFETTVRHLEELRGIGCRIGLDDFGSGYSSLSYLHRLPVDFLKLDRELVSEVDTSDGAFQVVSSAVALGQALGVATVAEGIERPAQAEALARMGCLYGQGWLFGRPEPLSQRAPVSPPGG